MAHKFWSGLMLIVTALVFNTIQCNAQKTVKIQFDSKMEVSGQKFAIKDISPGLPTNWD